MKPVLLILCLISSSVGAFAQIPLKNSAVTGTLITQSNAVIIPTKASSDDGVTKTLLTVKSLLNYFGVTDVKPADAQFFFTESGIILADKSGSTTYGTVLERTGNDGATIFTAKKGYIASAATFLSGALTGEVSFLLEPRPNQQTHMKISFIGHKASDSSSTTEQTLTGTFSGDYKGNF